MKAVIYCRVSTDEQTADNQAAVLEAWAKDRDFELVEIYRENETAWKAGHQRELSRLIKDARQGQFKLVLVWALDRLSREGALAILSLVHKLGSLGVKVLSYQETWTEAPGELTDLLLALTGWVAKMESNRRSERTKAGLERLRAKGKPLGRPRGAQRTQRNGNGEVNNYVKLFFY